MHSSRGVLILGHDPALLETRKLVLNRGGFQVWTTTKVTEAVDCLLHEPVDLFILCQSLPARVCEHMLETAHTLRPDVFNLLLGRQQFTATVEKHDHYFYSFMDPPELILVH